MKNILISALLLLLSACSAKMKLPDNPGPAPEVICKQPQSTEPVDGGLGGTGALPEENCAPTAVQ